MDPLAIVASTADAAFGTDEEGRVVLWNRAAERLLGYGPSQVLNRACHEVLCGQDVFGNRFCDESCTLVAMTRRREPIRRFALHLRGESGRLIHVEISAVIVPGPRESQYTILHLLKPIAAVDAASGPPPLPANPAPAAVSPPEAPPQAPHPLTPREIEVLRRLADGLSTPEIADSLFISVITVRNHVQNILKKLGVHSKLEAVSLALRRRLL